MSISKESNALVKKDVSKSRLNPISAKKISFAHQVTSGQVGLVVVPISLLALNTPTEMVLNGYVQATQSEINGANLAITKKSLNLISSLKGPLFPNKHYVVVDNYTINLIGDLAAQLELNEIIFGTIDSQIGDLVPASVRRRVKTVSVAAGQTTANLGLEFQVGSNLNERVGDIIVQARSKDNSATSVKYYISNSQSIANNTLTTVQWNSVIGTDLYSAMNTSTGVLSIKVPGRYRVDTGILGPSTATGQSVVYIYKNTVLIKTLGLANSAFQITPTVSDTFDCIVGDLIEIKFFQSSGAPYTINPSNTYNWFSLDPVGLDSSALYRNTGNSSTVLDGDYYEVDSGNGFGTTIVLNKAPVGALDLVVDYGPTTITNNDSLGTLQSLMGSMIKMAKDLAIVFGGSQSDYLSANPSEVERRTFGDSVLSLLTRVLNIESKTTIVMFKANSLTPIAITSANSQVTNLKMNNIVVDTHNGWNATTGLWTVPVGQSGYYRASAKTQGSLSVASGNWALMVQAGAVYGNGPAGIPSSVGYLSLYDVFPLTAGQTIRLSGVILSGAQTCTFGGNDIAGDTFIIEKVSGI